MTTRDTGCRLPNFLIVGAGKCGTTSLYAYLKQHPEVFMSALKEPNFFAGPTHGNRVDEAAYLALFADARDEKAVGEASVAYFCEKETPQRIYEYLGPTTRILIMLRNPVDMAYALWGHMARAGGEKLPFWDALQAGEARLADEHFRRNSIGWVYHYAYFDRGRYAPQVARYEERFGRNQVKVVIFEEFFQDASAGFRDVCRFLGVRDDFEPEWKVHNPTGPVISERFRDAVNERRLWKEPLKILLPKSLRLWLKTRAYWWNRREDIPLPPLPLDGREKAWELFEPEVAATEKLLGRSLRHVWRKEAVSRKARAS